MSTGCQKDRQIQQDVRKTETQADRQTDRRQKDFSAYLSKQKLLRMSTGCQKDRQTDRQTERQTEKQKQTDRKTDGRRKQGSRKRCSIAAPLRGR